MSSCRQPISCGVTDPPRMRRSRSTNNEWLSTRPPPPFPRRSFLVSLLLRARALPGAARPATRAPARRAEPRHRVLPARARAPGPARRSGDARAAVGGRRRGGDQPRVSRTAPMPNAPSGPRGAERRRWRTHTAPHPHTHSTRIQRGPLPFVHAVAQLLPGSVCPGHSFFSSTEINPPLARTSREIFHGRVL